MSYLDILQPKTGKTLDCLFKCSCKLLSRFFCVRKNCLVTSSSSSSRHSPSNFNTVSLGLRLSFNKAKLALRRLLMLVSNSKNSSFIRALLCACNSLEQQQMMQPNVAGWKCREISGIQSSWTIKKQKLARASQTTVVSGFPCCVLLSHKQQSESMSQMVNFSNNCCSFV